MKTEATFYVRIYMAGALAVAEQVCREECAREGLCINISPRNYIYSFGEEAGFCVELIQYPRFPTPQEEIERRAEALAHLLADKCCQRSFTLMTPYLTKWWARETA